MEMGEQVAQECLLHHLYALQSPLTEALCNPASFSLAGWGTVCLEAREQADLGWLLPCVQVPQHGGSTEEPLH